MPSAGGLELYITGTDPTVYNPETGVYPPWADPPNPNDLAPGVLSARIANSVCPPDWGVDEAGRPVVLTAAADAPENRGLLGKWGPNRAGELSVVGQDHTGKRFLLLAYRMDVREVAPGVKRKLYQWSLPGGMVDEGEFVKDTMLREIEEEANLPLRSLVPKVLYQLVTKDFRNGMHGRIETTGGYLLLPYVPETEADGTEIDIFGWFEIKGSPKEFIKNLPKPPNIADEDHVPGMFASHDQGVAAVFEALQTFGAKMEAAQIARRELRHEDALRLQREASELVPESVEQGIALRGQAASYERLGEYDAAIATAQSAVAVHDKFLELVPAEATDHVAVVRRELGVSKGMLGRVIIGSLVHMERNGAIEPADARREVMAAVGHLTDAVEDIAASERTLGMVDQDKIHLLSRLALAHALYGGVSAG